MYRSVLNSPGQCEVCSLMLLAAMLGPLHRPFVCLASRVDGNDLVRRKNTGRASAGGRAGEESGKLEEGKPVR